MLYPEALMEPAEEHRRTPRPGSWGFRGKASPPCRRFRTQGVSCMRGHRGARAAADRIGQFSGCAKIAVRECPEPFAELHAAVPPNSSHTHHEFCLVARELFRCCISANFQSAESAGRINASSCSDAGRAFGEMERSRARPRGENCQLCWPVAFAFNRLGPTLNP